MFRCGSHVLKPSDNPSFEVVDLVVRDEHFADLVRGLAYAHLARDRDCKLHVDISIGEINFNSVMKGLKALKDGLVIEMHFKKIGGYRICFTTFAPAILMARISKKITLFKPV